MNFKLVNFWHFLVRHARENYIQKPSLTTSLFPHQHKSTIISSNSQCPLAQQLGLPSLCFRVPVVSPELLDEKATLLGMFHASS